MRPGLVLDARAALGEGPAWEARTQILYWVDILEKRIYAGTELLLQLDDYVGCVAPRREGGLVLALRSGFWSLDLPTAKLTRIAAPAGEPPTNRFNDGKCDPRGRFLAGTMDMNEKEASGSLYSLSQDGGLKKLLDGIRISNGLAWSPDCKTLYYIDTPTRRVEAFDYDVETGEIANPRVALCIPESLGWPDGMTSDTEGNLWIAMWGGAQVTRWDPHGSKLLEQIHLPALQVSSCVFGGAKMNELYITSARSGLDELALARYPLSGGLFQVETNVAGMPTFDFAR